MNSKAIDRAAILVAALFLLGDSAAAQSLPVPVTGSRLHITLTSGDEFRGELIEAMGDSLLLGGPSGLEAVDLADVARIRGQRHGLDGKVVLTWVAVGGLVTGAGLAIACSQVEDVSGCGGVFPAVVLSWGLIGGLLGSGVAATSWRDLPLRGNDLRAYARFPQGAPRGFRREREEG